MSRRTGQEITLTKEEARAELEKYQQELTANPGLFGQRARERSDCGSCRNDGDLGAFSDGMMQKPFQDASFALKVGEMSGIVDTDSGLHLILRTA